MRGPTSPRALLDLPVAVRRALLGELLDWRGREYLRLSAEDRRAAAAVRSRGRGAVAAGRSAAMVERDAVQAKAERWAAALQAGEAPAVIIESCPLSRPTTGGPAGWAR